jgi:hypothetical protein
VSPVKYEQFFYIPEDEVLHSHCRENSDVTLRTCSNWQINGFSSLKATINCILNFFFDTVEVMGPAPTVSASVSVLSSSIPLISLSLFSLSLSRMELVLHLLLIRQLRPYGEGQPASAFLGSSLCPLQR